MKLGLLILLALVCCTPSPTPITPAPDASDAASLPETGTSCVAACAALTKASCPLGSAPSCPAFLQGQTDAGSMPNPAAGNRPLTCAEIATQVRTTADAQRLGFACQ